MDNWFHAPPYWMTVLAQLLFSVLCGGIIGYQRETTDRPAGLRTHVLVCVGSTVFMMVSALVAGDRFDAGRIAAQVASGIGFLGAGTIIKQGNIIRGLTTAASVWAVAGIGLAIGYGGAAFLVAALGTLVVLGALTVLHTFESRIAHARICQITLTLRQPRQHLPQIRARVKAYAGEISSFTLREAQDGVGEITLEAAFSTGMPIEEVMDDLATLDDVTGIRWHCR